MAEIDPFLVSARFWDLVRTRYRIPSDYTRTKRRSTIKKLPQLRNIDTGTQNPEIERTDNL